MRGRRCSPPGRADRASVPEGRSGEPERRLGTGLPRPRPLQAPRPARDLPPLPGPRPAAQPPSSRQPLGCPSRPLTAAPGLQMAPASLSLRARLGCGERPPRVRRARRCRAGAMAAPGCAAATYRLGSAGGSRRAGESRRRDPRTRGPGSVWLQCKWRVPPPQTLEARAREKQKAIHGSVLGHQRKAPLLDVNREVPSTFKMK
ncbi:translation initiation factor IF-2-like [Chelonia mydas]|uniref:translation initiation factor IF-2-like n=1 Tax=Chelonia mydas TaxID=8469 RepID=UPI001CAA1C5B|nr:translation initiation factor IF-2-like [Chelonia mydas]